MSSRTCSSFGLEAGAKLTWNIPSSLSVGDDFDFTFSLPGADDGIDCREISIVSSSAQAGSFVRVTFPQFDYGSPAWGCQYGSSGGCCDFKSQCDGRECRNCDNGGKRWVSIGGSDDDVCFQDVRHLCGNYDYLSSLSPNLGMQALTLPVVLSVVSAPSGNFDRPTEGSFTVRVALVEPPTPRPSPQPTPGPPTRTRFPDEVCDYVSLGRGTGCTGPSTEYGAYYDSGVVIYPDYNSEYRGLGKQSSAAEYCEVYCNKKHNCNAYVGKYIGTSGNLFKVGCRISEESPTDAFDNGSGHQVSECMKKLVDTCRARPTPVPTPSPIDVGSEVAVTATTTCSSCVGIGCVWCESGSNDDSDAACLCEGKIHENSLDGPIGMYYGSCEEYSGSEAKMSCESSSLGAGAIVGIVAGVGAVILMSAVACIWFRKKYVAAPSSSNNSSKPAPGPSTTSHAENGAESPYARASAPPVCDGQAGSLFNRGEGFAVSSETKQMSAPVPIAVAEPLSFVTAEVITPCEATGAFGNEPYM